MVTVRLPCCPAPGTAPVKLQSEDHVGLAHGARGQRVRGRKVHAVALVDHASLQELSELHEQVDARLVVGHAARHDDRILRGYQPLGDLAERVDVSPAAESWARSTGRRGGLPVMDSSCICVSMASTTGPIGGVSAIL